MKKKKLNNRDQLVLYIINIYKIINNYYKKITYVSKKNIVKLKKLQKKTQFINKSIPSNCQILLYLYI